MTLSEFVLKWNNTWAYDFWWRQKYKVPFGSKEHLDANQIDIAIEYVEDKLAEEAFKDHKKKQENKDHLEKTGEWIRVDDKKQKKLFDNIDISNL